MSTSAAKQRLDTALVERRLVETRQKAQALVLAGKVRVDGQRADKPGRPVYAASRIEVEAALPYVSRGGVKLAHALDHFGINVEGRICLDVGTSTGGFTDCLLQRGALRVHAVDTGAGQIDWRLRTDARVILHENTNARFLSASDVSGDKPSLIVCDVSFISVTLLLPAITAVLAPEGDLVILIKPQFEVGRELVGKGGIVRDPGAWQAACRKVADALTTLDFTHTMTDSPITGVEGNREFLLHGRRKAPE